MLVGGVAAAVRKCTVAFRCFEYCNILRNTSDNMQTKTSSAVGEWEKESGRGEAGERAECVAGSHAIMLLFSYFWTAN